jgi:cell division protein ZapE
MSLSAAYKKFKAEQNLQDDPIQAKLISRLEVYGKSLQQSNSWLTPLSKLRKVLDTQISSCNGMYIWGGVGRGKSMIMNLFYDNLALDEKLRVHFHQFMLDIHEELNKLREQDSSAPLLQLAKQISAKYKLLCLDELQINNVADAMIVGRLFTSLMDNGVFVVFTSNRPPQDLFKDGLQRERFIPFIELLEARTEIYSLDGPIDYRLQKLSSLNKFYHYPLGKSADKFIADVILKLCGKGKLASKEILIADNRKLQVLECRDTLAIFTFEELCSRPMSAADYIAICKNFSTVIIKNIPKLSQDNHNEALRFITLIDCFYEHKTKLICSAEAAPEELYKGNKNRFEFDRTISRLNEMKSLEYQANENKA